MLEGEQGLPSGLLPDRDIGWDDFSWRYIRSREGRGGRTLFQSCLIVALPEPTGCSQVATEWPIFRQHHRLCDSEVRLSGLTVLFVTQKGAFSQA
jgi:hypothetical protein